MKLSTILNRDRNNLDIFRIIAACMVIYGHAYSIAPQAGYSDFIGRHLLFDNSNSLSVKIFFFISGLVVTNSLLDHRSALRFAIARFFRIWPALILTIVLSALALGPWVSTLSTDDYFHNPLVSHYILNNILLHTAYELPGVFGTNPYKVAVNGSLWTIPYEIAAYLAVLGLFAVGVFRYRPLALLIALAVFLDPLVENRIMLTLLPNNPHISLLSPWFAFGMLLACAKDHVKINLIVVAGAWVLCLLLMPAAVGKHLFNAALFLSILWIAGTPWAVRLKLPIDVSYGTYLWGFVIQQLLVYFFPDLGIVLHQAVAIALALAIGWLSWHYIEYPGIQLGRWLYARFNAFLRPTIAPPTDRAATPGNT